MHNVLQAYRILFMHAKCINKINDKIEIKISL